MKQTPFKLIAASLLTLGMSSTTTADDDTSSNNPLTGSITLGAGSVTGGSYSFGRFSGLDDDRAILVGDFDLALDAERSDHLHFSGRNLGLRNRYLSLRYGRQGDFETWFEYRQLPNLTTDSAQTPYQGAGRDTLTLRPGASPDVLHPVTLETERKRAAGGITFHLPKGWSTSLAISHESKEGKDSIGGALQRNSGGAGISIGQTYAVILPEPIDQTTTTVDAALEYNSKQSQVLMSLHGSFFNNAHSRLQWENPGFTVSGRRTTLPDDGQLALAPDNRFFQLGLSGATRLGDNTRLTGVASAGMMQQDAAFLPYGLGSSSALPRDSLDGKVYVYALRAALSSRPVKPLRLKLKYRYDERDNRTPSAAYLYDVMDSGKTPNPGIAISNTPLSYQKHRASIDANYRINGQWRSSAGYEFRHTERQFSDVEQNREHKIKGALRWAPRDDLDAALKLSLSNRDASEYQAESPDQNPLLRKYDLADRERTTAGLWLNHALTEQLNLGLGVDQTRDDYTDSRLGLTDSRFTSYNVDLSYAPKQGVNLSAFYTRDQVRSEIRGSDPGVVELYRATSDDKVDTIGLSTGLEDLWVGWDLELTYSYSRGTGDIRYTDLDPVGAASSFPTLENRRHTLELTAGHQLNKRTRVTLAAAYEHLRTEDWLLDDVAAYPDNRLLTLGSESEDHDAFAVMIAVKYEF